MRMLCVVMKDYIGINYYNLKKNINKLGKLEKSGEGYKSHLKTAMCINLLNRYLMGF